MSYTIESTLKKGQKEKDDFQWHAKQVVWHDSQSYNNLLNNFLILLKHIKRLKS